MKKLLLFTFLCSALAGNSQVTTEIPTVTFNGFTFDVLHAAGSLSGTLTSVEISATLDASVLETYADDLTIYVTPTSTLGANGVLQLGGFSNTGALERQAWPEGASETPGTVVSGVLTLTTPLDFTLNPEYQVWIGNGYGGEGTSGTWSNIVVTLNGVVDNTASVNDFFANNISIYPNPTSDIFNLASTTSTIESIKLTDLNGRVVKNINVNSLSSTEVNISDLTSGMYFVTVQTDNGSGSTKIIKK